MTALRFPVEAGQIMLFARAIGDPNPVYHDSEAAKETNVAGIIAPPTFVVAGAQYDPDYPLRPKIGHPWFGSGREASGVTAPLPGGGGLHAEQHFTYHRPIRPGDVLTATTRRGETWEKVGRRSGKLVFEEMISEYRDAEGELVVTSRAVAARQERTAEVSA